MSLRDAFLAKGLVTEKRAKQIDRELKAKRKAEQAHRKKLGTVQAEQEAAAKAEAEARRAQSLADRAAASAAREAHEQVHRLRRLILDNRLGGRGGVPFWHRVGTTPRLHRMMLPEALAADLRSGRAALAAFQDDDRTWQHHIVSDKAADRIAAIDATALVHRVGDTAGLSDPSEVFLARTWDASLRPHRIRNDTT